MISLRIIALRRVSVFSRNEHLFSPCCRSRTRVFPNWRGTFLQPSRANSNSSNRGSSEGMNRILSRVVLCFGRSHNHLASDHRVEQEHNETKQTGGAVDRKAQSDESWKEEKEHNVTKQTKGAVDRKAWTDESWKEHKEYNVTKMTRGATDRRAWSDESWKEQKEKYLNMPEEEKRRQYTYKSVGLNDVPTWSEYYRKHKRCLPEVRPTDHKIKKKEANDELNEKVSIWRGDITKLRIDCIVNAANESLLGGGGVDGAIHRAAGMNLKQECATLKGCQTGEAKITGAYKLPSKYIIHTVGPIGHGDDLLENCYGMSLSIMTENGLHSIAFPCISTGIYGFPADRAAHIALDVARTYLERNRDSVDRIIFCLFMDHDVRLYEKLMQVYFPVKEELEASEDRTPSENSVKHSRGDTDAPAKQLGAAQKGQKDELTDSSENIKPKKNKLDPKQSRY